MRTHFFLSVIIVAVTLGALLGACTDDVDKSDMYTFRGQTVLDILSTDPDYSNYKALLERVKFSSNVIAADNEKVGSSTAAQLLATRGNYTVFAPTNEALQSYIDSHDDKAYLSVDFPAGVLDRTNLDDRFIAVDFQPGEERLRIVLNSSSNIVRLDLQASNGVVHGIDHVLSFTNSNLAQLIRQTPNLQIFGQLLQITHWQDSLTKYRDQEYEKYEHGPGNFYDGITNYPTLTPLHRYYGYTAFVETDSVLQLYWQLPTVRYKENGTIENWEYEIYPAIIRKCKELYPEFTDTDPVSENNPVNKFVAYHLLPERIRWDQIVLHHCEMGYGYDNPTQLGVDCYEYYETMGYKQRRLMKITEGAQSDGKRINRKVTYDYGEYGNELNVKSVERPGILITENNGKYIHQALNGFYYLISEPLVYDEGVPNSVGNPSDGEQIQRLLYCYR